MMRDRKSDTHRKVAEKVAGRKLGPNEIVHHKDEDKANNSDANLAVEPRGTHTAAHNRSRGLSKLRASLRMHRDGKKIY
jgi:hypothetical protein